MERQVAGPLPGWVPEGARRYLAHTVAGQAIRDLARGAGCHASTVLRQIRRIETRRDDPLVDAALTALAETHFPPIRTRPGSRRAAAVSPKDTAGMQTSHLTQQNAPDGAALDREALRVLRRLCESGAVLAVAEQMEKAVVVRDAGAGDGTRTAVVDRAVAEAMALQDWIACANPGRISRYRITAAGRAALGRLLAESENRARAQKESGFGEAQAAFAGPERAGSASMADESGERARRVRYNMA